MAQIKLPDFIKEQRGALEARGSCSGNHTFGQSLARYRQELWQNTRLKLAGKLYRQKTIEVLIKTWLDLEAKQIKSISEVDFQSWAKSYHAMYSPTVFNNTVDTLRHIIAIGVKDGARYTNPAQAIKKAKIRLKELVLPEHQKFLELVAEVENAGARFSKHCADLIRFLAFGGFRKREAANIRWADCDVPERLVFQLTG